MLLKKLFQPIVVVLLFFFQSAVATSFSDCSEVKITSSNKPYQIIKMSSLLDLPDELILEVLSYTEIAEVLKCGQVSKRIRTISDVSDCFKQ